MATKKSTADTKKTCRLSQEFIDTQREELLSEMQRISQRIQISQGNLKRDKSHENVEETGSEDFIHAADLSMLGADAERVNMIESALKKMAKGTYGICEDCGKPIGEARLKARPFAHYCIACKSIREEKSSN